jgi:RND family efflux transporter MFP subunit
MSPESVQTPNIRRLKQFGGGAVALALVVGVGGFLSRAHSAQGNEQWSAVQAIPTVALAKVDRGTTSDMNLPGAVQPFEIAQIYARVPGYLQSWRRDIGANVKAGDVLATIDTPDLDQQLVQAKADLATAQANQRLASLTAKRWAALQGSEAVSQQAVDEKSGDEEAKTALVAAARANVGRLQALEVFKRVTAPFDGVVTARKTDIGALINAGSTGQELFEVDDLHRLRIYVQVPQVMSSKIAIGQAATFTVPQFPGQPFPANVVAFSHAMDLNSRSMTVQLQADNPGEKLAAGSYAQVAFKVAGDSANARVPSTALIVANSGTQIAVLGAGGRAVVKPVKLGRDLGDQVEITAGLQPGDHVIDSPPEYLRNGDAVRLASRAPTHQGS